MPNHSIVLCPACRRRLRIEAARPGLKIGCPACQAPFTLGNRVGSHNSDTDFIAFELFDATLALDDVIVAIADSTIPVANRPSPPMARIVRAESVAKEAPKPLLKPGETEHPIGETPKKNKKRRRNEDGEETEDEWDDEQISQALGYHSWGEPRYRSAWTLVYWGLTLVLFSILLYGGGAALGFVSLAFVSGSSEGIAALGMIGIAFILIVVTDVVRLAGFALCLGVPGKTSARSYLWIAIGMSLASLGTGLFRVIVSFLEPFLAANIVAVVGVGIGFMSFVSFLVFMETVAEMHGERGIADSVAGLIKLTALLGLMAGAGLAAQLGAMYWVTLGTAPRWLNPNSGDSSIYVIAAIATCFTAFIGILGIVVLVKFIFALLNVRQLVEQDL